MAQRATETLEQFDMRQVDLDRNPNPKMHPIRDGICVVSVFITFRPVSWKAGICKLLGIHVNSRCDAVTAASSRSSFFRTFKTQLFPVYLFENKL